MVLVIQYKHMNKLFLDLVSGTRSFGIPGSSVPNNVTNISRKIGDWMVSRTFYHSQVIYRQQR